MMAEHMFSMEPIDRLFETQGDAAEFLEVDVRRYRRWLEKGVNWDLADRIAAGSLRVHPSTLWPEWYEVAEAESDLTLFEDDRPAKKEVVERPAPDYEGWARARKVRKLVAELKRQGATPKAAKAMTVADRKDWAKAAGCNKPSDTTWAMVVAELEAALAVAS